MSQADDNTTRDYDEVITKIVDYAYDYQITSAEAWIRAKATLLDALGAAFEGLHTSDELWQFLGPSLPGGAVSGGFKVPGTPFQLDILKGAFDMGAMIRYLDHNDAFPGAEWGHPSGKSHQYMDYFNKLTGEFQTISAQFLRQRTFARVWLSQTVFRPDLVLCRTS